MQNEMLKQVQAEHEKLTKQFELEKLSLETQFDEEKVKIVKKHETELAATKAAASQAAESLS